MSSFLSMTSSKNITLSPSFSAVILLEVITTGSLSFSAGLLGPVAAPARKTAMRMRTLFLKDRLDIVVNLDRIVVHLRLDPAAFEIDLAAKQLEGVRGPHDALSGVPV